MENPKKSYRYLTRKIKKELPDLLQTKGAFLYSGINTLRPGKFYLLGLNSGGDDGWTLEKDLLEKQEHPNKNNFLDFKWENNRGKYSKGDHPLQENLDWLFEQLGTPLKNVCASNLIFTQSAGELGARYPEIAKKCWPVQEEVLSIVKPRFVVAFGNSWRSPYAFIKDHVCHGDKIDESRFPSSHGNLSIKHYDCNISGQNIKVIDIPHMSRYKIIGRKNVINGIFQLTR